MVLQGSLTGLAAAHRRGVVHRDYKPENVLVNGGGVSKLTDLGLAGAFCAFTAGNGRHTSMAGTTGFIAPEVVAGGNVSPASDVCSSPYGTPFFVYTKT